MTNTDWIAVEDGLPETSDAVLCYFMKTQFTASWSASRGYWLNDECIQVEVTHWQRLPDDPSDTGG